MIMLQTIATGVLEVSYLDAAVQNATPVILLHGFPYDVHAFAAVTPLLAARGCRVIVPYLRGYRPTRFLSSTTPRSGQQAALAHDLVDLMDRLAISRAVVAGFDWGGRAACIAAALWPERILGLVSAGGYTIQDIPGAAAPAAPENEYRFWYQYYFHTERGRAGLAKNRRELCRLLWRLWSPTWKFTDAEYGRTSPAFDNPDFVEVVIHSYRHRFGLVPGDPAVEETERRLTELPTISVPTITLDGEDDGVLAVGGTAGHRRFFTGWHEHRVLKGVGHNPPQEAPGEFAAAVLSVVDAAAGR